MIIASADVVREGLGRGTVLRGAALPDRSPLLQQLLLRLGVSVSLPRPLPQGSWLLRP